MLTYVKREIDAAQSKLICCYGETLQKQVQARKRGCKDSADMYLELGVKQFLYMFALSQVSADNSGLTGFNVLTAEQVAQIVEYVVETCGCLCVAEEQPAA